MEDVRLCPICGKKLTNQQYKQIYLAMFDKRSDYIQRTCTKGTNHSVQLMVDGYTGQVDLLKLSLNPQYTRWVEINFVTGKSKISCLKNGKPEHMEIDRALEPDFPHLIRLKAKVGIYVVFS